MSKRVHRAEEGLIKKKKRLRALRKHFKDNEIFVLTQRQLWLDEHTSQSCQTLIPGIC